MKYIDFQRQFRKFNCFSLNEIRKIDPGFDRRRLAEWKEKGYIRGVIRGHYVFADRALSEERLFDIANTIYKPSYVSLEMALGFFGLIPEAVYSVTSVATRKTMTFHTPQAVFRYHSVKPALFFGYDIVPVGQEGRYKMARPEKAVLDYLYFHPDLDSPQAMASLRFNRDVFAKLKKTALLGFARRFASPRLMRQVRHVMEVMDA